MVRADCDLWLILRAALYVSLAVLSLYFSTYSVAKYMEGEVIILSSGDEQETFTFPSITFCRNYIFDQVLDKMQYLSSNILFSYVIKIIILR
jgi:hypothetical protein